MFSKLLLVFFIFINFFSNLYANEKLLIINQLIKIDNITFDFVQITNQKKELGSCILVFNNKLKCSYQDSKHKEVLINGKRLVVSQKRYNKNYFYPISNSFLIKILNKNSLINLIQESNYELKNNIELLYLDKNKRKITILFDKKNLNLIGWKVVDQLQNNINFSLKIKSINSKVDSKLFIIPSSN